MKFPTATHRQLLETLRGQLIPWANSSAPFVLLSAPPRVIGSNQVSERPGKALPLKHGNGRIVREQYWSDQNMNSTSVPYFGCVTEGEADLVVGTTTAMCRKMKIPGKRWIIQMPKGSFFLLPPGIPFCGGADIHWERHIVKRPTAAFFGCIYTNPVAVVILALLLTESFGCIPIFSCTARNFFPLHIH